MMRLSSRVALGCLLWGLSRVALAQSDPFPEPFPPALPGGPAPLPPALPGPKPAVGPVPVMPSKPVPESKVPPTTADGTPLVTAVETYETWLRRYDGRFSSLEERIARASQGLDTLEFEVLGDVGDPAGAIVSHGVETGNYFALEELRYSLDGVPIASRILSSERSGAGERFDIFSGRIVPGQHTLTVEMFFRVKGFELAVGELRNARLRAKGSLRFEAKEGFLSRIEVTGKDTGSAKPTGLSVLQAEKRFRVLFNQREEKYQSGPASVVPAPSAPSAPVAPTAPAPSAGAVPLDKTTVSRP